MTLPPSFQHGNVRLWSLTTGAFQENVLLIAGADNRGFLIDPGDEADKILDLVRQAGVQVEAILLTHAHIDHIGAVQPVREALRVPVYMHPDGAPLYGNVVNSAARWGLSLAQPDAPEHEITQGQVFTAGDLKLTARDLPGHAPGHVILVGDDFVIAGDTLFAGSIGRTDLPGGNHAQLLEGIQRELLTLPESHAVYPGHGQPTTIGREKKQNPFLN